MIFMFKVIMIWGSHMITMYVMFVMVMCFGLRTVKKMMAVRYQTMRKHNAVRK